MANPVPETDGELATDVQGALEQARAAGDSIAVGVYEDVIAGKLPIEKARDEVLVREALS